jgi:carbonic anhydrase
MAILKYWTILLKSYHKEDNNMKTTKHVLLTAFIGSLFLATQAANADVIPTTSKWGYSGSLAPQYWGSLEKKFSTCSKGTQQSPIAIKTAAAVKNGEKMRFVSEGTSLVSVTDDQTAAADVFKETGNIARSDNGRTVQFTFSHLTTKEAVEIDGKSYQLVEAHFHKASEHTLDGKHFPLEVHSVHATKDGKLAAVATFIAEGKANPGFTALLDAMPEKSSQKGIVAMTSAKVDMDWFIPHERTYYAYKGSLTTPPCGEEVQWIVMAQPVEASKEQIERMKALIPEDNARPLQPLNGRKIRQISE